MVLCNLPYRLREIAGRIAKKCRRRKDRSLEAKLEDILSFHSKSMEMGRMAS